MHKSVVIFEAEGGTDKGEDGHRRDTMPIAEALKFRGWNADVVFYSDEAAPGLLASLAASHDAYIPRVNPGTLPGGDGNFHNFLRDLSTAGLIGLPHPDTMVSFGAKDALTRLADTDLVPSDTFAYQTLDELKAGLPMTLAGGERVLKQNRGSTGSGIWRVQVVGASDGSNAPAASAPLSMSTPVRCTEAVDNHVEEWTLGEFMNRCEEYLVGDDGLIVDMKFLPRVNEGEIRILYVGPTPVVVVHKVPADSEDAFSATLFSGAKYTYQEPSEWAPLVAMFDAALPTVADRLGQGGAIPLIWTADFLLDTADDGSDCYALGELNCSCVGFTSELDRGIQDRVAEQVIKVVEASTA